MKISKKIVSLVAALALASSLGVFAASASADNKIDPDLAITEVNDATIEEPKEEIAVSESIVEDEASGLALAGELPSDVTLQVSEVPEADYRSDATNCSGEVFLALDISPMSDGAKWQPADSKAIEITVDMAEHGIADGTVVGVIHDNGGELCESLGEYTVMNGEIAFETEGFSDFYFYVKFERDGYSYTLSGGAEVYLSELLSNLGVDRSVGEVASVEFSTPEYVSVEQAGSDWLLTSLSSFGTSELLVVTFNDGEVIEIGVSDPHIYNYAVGSDITNVAKLATKKHTVQKVDNGDSHALDQTYIVNEDQITVANVKEAGAKEKKAGVHPAPDTVHMIIYAEEGMAIDFIGGTDWTYAGSKPTFNDDEIWFWSWESSVKANYVVIKDKTAGKQDIFTVTTKVDDVTYYCNVLLCVVEKSSPRLLSDALPKINAELKSNYSLKNVPVTLYNYDGKTWNEYYNAKEGNYLAFSGKVKGVDTTENAGNRGWTGSGVQANGGGSVALMGILKDELVDGLPVMSQGQQVDLFSTNEVPGKEVYENVGFQFVYNEDTKYYSYNAALNHAQYNSATNELELYEQSLALSDTPNGASHGNGGFYPFADIKKAFTNTGYTQMNSTTWAQKLERDAYELIPSEYSTDIVTTSSTDPVSTEEMHYGLQIDAQFYLPADKKINGQSMVYNFTGDDDLWVFIDGQLVLDIGGGHTYVSGSFDLTSGEVWVEKYTQLAAEDGGSYDERVQGVNLEYTDEFLTSLEGDQMHRIQIFYLERHGGVSNCNMHFNLPIVPTSAVEVSKSLDLVSGVDESVVLDGSVTASDGAHGEENYTFTVYVAKEDNDVVEDESVFEPLKGAAYTVMGTGIEGQSARTTDKNSGSFTLRPGQTAYFDGIDRFTEVYVVESTPPSNYEYTDKGEVSVNSEETVKYEYGEPCETKVVQKDEKMTFSFTNHMVAQDLTITKSGVFVPLDHDNTSVSPEDAEYQSTVFTVVGPSGTIEAAVKGNGSVTVKDLIPGTYTVSEGNTEGSNWAWRYSPGEGLQTQEAVITNSDHTLTFANTRVNQSWLNGGNWCRNVFKDGQIVASNALNSQASN